MLGERNGLGGGDWAQGRFGRGGLARRRLGARQIWTRRLGAEGIGRKADLDEAAGAEKIGRKETWREGARGWCEEVWGGGDSGC